MRSNLIDIAGVLHHQTEKAILFSDTGEKDDAVWIPKSVIEMEVLDPKHPDQVVVTMPERMAIDRGLV